MTLDVIVSFFITSLVLTLAPGPDILYVLSTSITQGKKYGIAAALGLSSGLLIHTTLLAFGISSLIVAIPWLFVAIKIFGTIYLLRIIYLMYKQPLVPISFDMSNAVLKKNALQQVQQGLMMNILNPKIMLFFLSLFPTFLQPDLGNLKIQIYTLGSVFMLQALIVFCLVAYLSSFLRIYLIKNPYIHNFLNYIQIAVFIALIVFMWL